MLILVTLIVVLLVIHQAGIREARKLALLAIDQGNRLHARLKEVESLKRRKK